MSSILAGLTYGGGGDSLFHLPPCCGPIFDQVGCGGNGDRIHRHDSVRDALFSAAQTAALAPRKEVQ